MLPLRLLFALLLAGCVAPVLALTISRTLLLPDGKPAAGAAVLVRLVTAEGLPQAERRTTADAKGVFTLEVDLDPAALPDMAATPGARQPGYLLIDAPGCALTFATLATPQGPPAPIRLGAAYRLQGLVQTPEGAPVAGAAVAVQALNLHDLFGLRKVALNNTATSLHTPALTTISDHTGAFTLRGVAYARDNSGLSARYSFAGGDTTTVPAAVAAHAASPIGVLVGEAILTYHLAPLAPGMNAEENNIRVLPAVTVRGTVIHAVTGAPLAGASVRLASSLQSVADRPSVLTGADGAFSFAEVAVERTVCVVATHPDLTQGWIRPLPKIGGVREGEVRLRPWTTVVGTVVDAVTGAAPPVPVTVTAIYDEGYADDTLQCGRTNVTATVGADGRFTLQTAVGANTLSTRAVGYRLGARVLALDVPATGAPSCALPLLRERGFLVHISPAAGLAVQTRLPGNLNAATTTTLPPHGWWFHAPRGPETTLEIRVIRRGTEVVPWTPITLDAKDWAKEIAVP